eukprot:gene1588-7955_t
MVCFLNPRIQESSAFFLMMFAWSLTETVRYNLYWIKLAVGTTPHWLMWLRPRSFATSLQYSIMIPSEAKANLQNIQRLAISHTFILRKVFRENVYVGRLSRQYAVSICLLMLLYPTVFPSMYLYMFSQRKKYLYPKPARPEQTEGIQFPKDAQGNRSTSVFGQAAFAASVFDKDPQAAIAVMREKNWRFSYGKHVLHNVALSCRSTTDCVEIAQAGLHFLHKNFEFVRDGKAMSLETAMKEISGSFHTMQINGAGTLAKDFIVPYDPAPYPKTTETIPLAGEELKKQLQRWVDKGTIEPSARDAIAMVSENKKWLDLRDKYFVLLGAGSAMGPYEVLLALGANIIAVDLNRPGIWKRLINMARQSPGTIIFPVKDVPDTLVTEEKIFESAGCDLFLNTPEICNWLKTVKPDKELIIGSYAYLDGEKHVRVSIAMDAIIKGVIQAREPATSLAYLCSPTDVFVVDKETRDAAEANYKSPSFAKTVGNLIKKFKKTAVQKNIVPPAQDLGGNGYYMNDGIVVAQGPNYALAKRIQHWRAMVARNDGHPVSSNIAPSTATLSVVHNPQFKAAYGGFPFFHPFEVARQETSNAVMGALLVHDICNTDSTAYPKTDIGNPINLFKFGAFHGGVWRCGFKVGSIGETAVTLFYLTTFGPKALQIAAGLAVAAGAFAVTVL